MRLAQFKMLNEEEQFDVIEQQGIFLTEREDAFYNIRLYHVENFYVELYCHTHFNVIVRSKAFSTPQLLDPYLNNIDIDGLMAN